MFEKINQFSTILLIFFFLLTYSNSFAQKSIGIKSGIHLSKYKVDYPDDNLTYDVDNIYGYEFGLIVNTAIYKKIKLISELNVIQKGGDYGDAVKLNELELDLLVAYEVPIRRFSLYANVGVFLGYMVSGNLVNLQTRRKKEIKFDPVWTNRWDSGIAFGGGIKYHFLKSSIQLESRFRRSITLFGKGPEYSSDLFDTPPTDYYRTTSQLFGMSLTLGYNYQF